MSTEPRRDRLDRLDQPVEPGRVRLPRFNPEAFGQWSENIARYMGTAKFIVYMTVVIGAWFAAARLRQGPGAPGDPIHVAVGCGAMVVMYLGMPAEHSSGTAGHAGHAGHAAMGTGAGSLLLVAVGLALTGYFAWHAWSTAAPADAPQPGVAPSAPETTTAVAARPRITLETAAHIVLDALMAVMFLGYL